MFSHGSCCFPLVLTGLMLGVTVGCGGSDSTTAKVPTDHSDPVVASLGSDAPQPADPPTDVVSQFLDLVRRGGQTKQAASLLTQKAQSELQRIGRSVQPIGSPDAQFQVTRFEKVPTDMSTDEQAALVHSLWTEPGEAGSNQPIQVVWAVQVESNQWKISGLAMEIEAGQEPVVINFEDGNRMAAILASAESEDASGPSSAGQPNAGQPGSARPRSGQPNDSTSQAAANDAVLSR